MARKVTKKKATVASKMAAKKHVAKKRGATDKTVKKQSPGKRGDLKPFKPGQSGNPNGRPKGSRNKLGESFLSDVLDDWENHGRQAVEKMRKERPHEYVKMIASILPKELSGPGGGALQARLIIKGLNDA